MVSSRVRCASSPLAPMSKTSNISIPSKEPLAIGHLPLVTSTGSPRSRQQVASGKCLPNPILQRHLHRLKLLPEQLDGQVVHHRVLRLVDHELFHRAVVAVVEQDSAG